MYQNDKIDNMEALQKIQLQELFDLSYDQFLKLSDKAVKSAINRGADPVERIQWIWIHISGCYKITEKLRKQPLIP